MFVLAMAAAFICAFVSDYLVYLQYNSSRDTYLQKKQEVFYLQTIRGPDGLRKDIVKNWYKPSDSENIDKQSQDDANLLIQIRHVIAKEDLEKLEHGFWVNLSSMGLAGVYILVGLLSAICSFIAVWSIYKLVEWLVLGFCNDKHLKPEST